MISSDVPAVSSTRQTGSLQGHRIKRLGDTAGRVGSSLSMVWGRSPVNRLADRAGRHRRLAAGFGLLAVPTSVMGSVLLRSVDTVPFAIAHFAMAASLLWSAIDLVRGGSLVDDRRRPLASSAALFVAVVGLHMSALSSHHGYRPLLTVGLVSLGVAIVLSTLADRSRNPLTGLGGRLFLVIGGPLVGVAELSGMVESFDAYPVYAVCLGMIGALLVWMAIFEARLLWRGIMLVFAVRSGA